MMLMIFIFMLIGGRAQARTFFSLSKAEVLGPPWPWWGMGQRPIGEGVRKMFTFACD